MPGIDMSPSPSPWAETARAERTTAPRAEMERAIGEGDILRRREGTMKALMEVGRMVGGGERHGRPGQARATGQAWLAGCVVGRSRGARAHSRTMSENSEMSHFAHQERLNLLSSDKVSPSSGGNARSDDGRAGTVWMVRASPGGESQGERRSS